MRTQIHKPQLLLAAGLVLMAPFVLGVQPAPASPAAPAGETSDPPTQELPAPSFESNCPSFASAVEKVAPAVVRIVTTLRPVNPAALADGAQDPLQRYLLEHVARGHGRRPLETGLGSGVIVTEDGYILTNTHLVGGMNEVEVTLQDGREFKARVIGLDLRSDIAVVKIGAAHLPTVPLANSHKVRVGDLVLAVGNPFGVGQTVTHGIVSATDRGGMGIEEYESFIQTDAPINPGNSGGALVDVSGHLIGISTAILSSSGGNLGIGFAVPSDLAHRVMTDLVKHGRVIRGYLGVEAQNLTPELAKEFHLPGATGALVGGVTPHSPAARAGLEVGDVITRFDGHEVRDSRQLKLTVAEANPLQTVQLEVQRNGSAKPLQVVLGEASGHDLLLNTERAAAPQAPGALQGVTLIELSSQVRQLLKVPGTVQGAVVLDLDGYSAAAQAGLRPGDVLQAINRQEIKTADEASRLTQSASERRALLRVWSQGSSHFLLVED